MRTLIHWLLSAAAIAITAYLLPGVSIGGVVPALVLAIVLGLINTFIRPLILILTLPISIVTLGIFALVVNTLLIMIAAAIVPGVTITSFWWALIFGIVLALVNSFLKGLQD